MNDALLGYLIRGVAADVNLPVDQVGAIVRNTVAAGMEKSPAPPAQREPPAVMQSMTVPPFCAHNINVAEECAACQRVASGGRVFALVLPVTTRVVYTLKGTST